ncbi:hypothetical protein LINPERPRIM_LOCUS28129 [Linum perenne]
MLNNSSKNSRRS